MAVSATLVPDTLSYGNPAEVGGTHGLFGGALTLTGAAGGGSWSVVVDFTTRWLQGKILIFRHVVLATVGTTARAANLNLLPGYLQTAGTTIGGSGIVTTVGFDRTVGVFVAPGAALLLKVPQNNTDPSVFSVAMPNTEDEVGSLFVQGEYWEEARLRSGKTGPLIRW